ncbi:MAG: indole-3-glycerol phosphate synthase TrpC [Clostridiales bacterium]|nr:indole-3-glycerol phosphate synthase TrpC [Clostridiales bacterium]
MSILDDIVRRTVQRIEEKRRAVPLAQMIALVEQKPASPGFPFEKALMANAASQNGVAFICEIKKASPSKGLIAEDFPYMQIAGEYEEAGAAAISVLTEPFFFQGDDRYLQEISREAHIPLLRKDFVMDEYMLYEAKALGASAVLLICAILPPNQISRYLQIADRLGLSCLVEAHDEAEIRVALAAGARVVGVNNRDLNTFTVDLGNSLRLRKLVPESVLFVAESGISGPEDVRMLRQSGVDAILVGEALMRAHDKKAVLARLADH